MSWPATVLLALLLVGAGWGLRGLALHQRARRRLWTREPEPAQGPTLAADALPEPGGLGHWLLVAGYGSPQAVPMFLIASGGALALGALLSLGVVASGEPARMARLLVELPGGYAGLLVPVVWAAPWILLAACGLAPYLVVNAARRRVVREVEQDLPLTLELLSALAQAGLGFDAAIARILDARPEPRPLFEALRQYQRDLLAGVPRLRALRAVSRRLEVGPVAVLVSALVQAEQLGASLSDVLRRQAEDVRARRRADVLIRAEALTVKLVFPLVICFMPGLFAFTLGPAFHQLFQLTDSFARGPR